MIISITKKEIADIEAGIIDWEVIRQKVIKKVVIEREKKSRIKYVRCFGDDYDTCQKVPDTSKRFVEYNFCPFLLDGENLEEKYDEFMQTIWTVTEDGNWRTYFCNKHWKVWRDNRKNFLQSDDFKRTMKTINEEKRKAKKSDMHEK